MQGQKGIYLLTEDYMKMFRSLSQPPIIVNDFDVSNEAEREKLNQLIYTRYDGDTLSNIPRCDCGVTQGGDEVNTRCPECHQLCLPVTEKPLESVLWLMAPDEIPGFINPQVWRIMSKHLTYSGFNILEYLTNPFYRPSCKTPPIVAKVDSMQLPMGLKGFHDHYDAIIDALYKNRIFSGRVSQRDKVYRYLQMVRKVTFTKYLPFPSKLAFITEHNNDKIHADHKMAPALDAIWTIASMYSGGEEPSLRMKESRCIRSITKLIDYYREFEIYTASKKPGIFRKLIYGARPHWTYRAVISSQHRPHKYDELELPWSLSTLLFKSHLANKLLKRKFTPNEIIALLYENTLRRHVLIESLFQELIDEAPGGGIPTTLGRNPTLKRGSIERFKITKIKTDPTINTISLSVLCLRAKNADFDGDALNGQLALDHKTSDALSRMDPHLGVMDLNRPFTVSRNIALPAPTLSTIGAWILEGDQISRPMEV
jgi:hypothetical protein